MVNEAIVYEHTPEKLITPERGCKTESVNWCAVKLSDVLNRKKRLEASVFDVEAKSDRALILNCKYGFIMLDGEHGLIDKAYYPGRFKRVYCSKNSGVPFYLPSQMNDIYPLPEKYISTITNCNIDELKIAKNTLLLTRSGTIGTVAYVSNTLNRKVFSDDVIRISFKNNIDLGFVYTFFKSKVGNKILATNGYGSVITHIEPEHLTNVPIPNAPNIIKQKINDLITKSYNLRDESNKLLGKATKMLMEELQLPSIEDLNVDDYDENSEVEVFNIKLSEMDKRLDASYHVPIVDAIIEHLQKHSEEVTTIGDARITNNIILAGVFKRTYVNREYGYPFLGGKEITQLNPQPEKYLSKAIHKKRYKKELRITENMILVTDRGSIGTVALVPKHWDGYAVSQNVLKVVPKDVSIAGYIYVFLNSAYGRELVKSKTYGSVVDMIDNNCLSSVAFPLLHNKDIQQQINDLALEANIKRYEAYKLEKEALRVMNEEVIFA